MTDADVRSGVRDIAAAYQVDEKVVAADALDAVNRYMEKYVRLGPRGMKVPRMKTPRELLAEGKPELADQLYPQGGSVEELLLTPTDDKPPESTPIETTTPPPGFPDRTLDRVTALAEHFPLPPPPTAPDADASTGTALDADGPMLGLRTRAGSVPLPGPEYRHAFRAPLGRIESCRLPQSRSPTQRQVARLYRRPWLVGRHQLLHELPSGRDRPLRAWACPIHSTP
jgi:hypothetical protein